MTLIMGRPTLTYEQLELAYTSLGAETTFVTEMLPALHDASLRFGLDPLAVTAQSAHETGYGKFGRATATWHRNTCGLKVRDITSVLALLPAGSTSEHPLCHAQFADWICGARAHGEHLRAYCQVPVDEDPVDPRYFLVWQANKSTGRRPAVHLADLDPWAGHAGYGDALEHLAAAVLSAAAAGAT